MDDVHFWMDYGFITESMKQYSGGIAPTNEYSQMMSAMSGMTDILYSDTYLSMGLNFEDGRMAMRSQLFFNEDMKQFYRRSLDTKFNKKFLRYVKGGDEMFGYFYLNYNIKNTIEETKSLLYKLFDATPQYGQAAADAMKIIGIFIDEEAVGNLLKGDLMVSVSGMQTVEVATKTYEYDADYNYVEKDTVMMQTMPVFTALASYGNGKDIQKFIDLGLHSNVLVQEGQILSVGGAGHGWPAVLAGEARRHVDFHQQPVPDAAEPGERFWQKTAFAQKPQEAALRKRLGGLLEHPEHHPGSGGRPSGQQHRPDGLHEQPRQGVL